MNFKQFNRDQGLLLPPTYDHFLGESHEALVLAEFIDKLDHSALEASCGNEHGGSSAYHPVMLLTVLIYGYMNGTFSSRKIAKALHQDLAFMYLSGNNIPDFRTLARFRKVKGAYLELVFKQVVERARELGFVTFGTVSLDGTKIYASAGKSRNETMDGLKEKISDLVKEAERIDAMEDEQYGDREDEVDPELKTKEGRAKKRLELEQERQKAEVKKMTIAGHPAAIKNGKTKVNTTDLHARFMKMKRGDFANGYNVQVMTENSIVLASHVGDNSNDNVLFMPMVRSFQEMHGETPERLLADKGYSGETISRFCEQENIDAYIPLHKEPVDLTKYSYDKEQNTYTDADGREFRFYQNAKRRGNECIVYRHVDETKKKKKNKYLSISHEWLRYAKKQKEKLATPEGKEIFDQRMGDVEPAFGNIKHNLRFTSFRLRGFAGVKNEWNLITIAHNLKKMLYKTA